MIFENVIIGGTFDHFHAGHEAFLRFVLSKSAHVLLGLTTDEYIKTYKSYSDSLWLFGERKRRVESFLRSETALDRVEIEPISSALCPPVWEKRPIDAVIVTSETLAGAHMIDEDRRRKGLSPLQIVIAPLLSEGNNFRISSTAIRSGIINTEGKHFIEESWLYTPLALPPDQRSVFHEPFGELLASIPSQSEIIPNKTITVGDVVTKDFNGVGYRQFLSVIDFTVARKKIHTSLKELAFSGEEEVYGVENPPGHIMPSVFTTLREIFTRSDGEKRYVLYIIGEEDLVVLPVILYAPLGYTLYYGQPRVGIVRVPISQQTKTKAAKFIKKFTYDTRGY